MTGPHQNQPLLHMGESLESASAAVVMLHGRGASAEDILSLVPEIHHTGFAYLAPQAYGNTWYPNSFLAPIASNEPGLSSGLAVISQIIQQLGEVGIPSEKIILLGFSQGACLSLEFSARHARRYGGIVGFSGGLIGPDGTSRAYPGSFAGTPVFLGCSDVDFHIPKERVQHTTQVMTQLGAQVTERLYANMGHTINQDEINYARQMLSVLI